MIWNRKKSALAALAGATLAATLSACGTAAMATIPAHAADDATASTIHAAPCDGRSDFLKIRLHFTPEFSLGKANPDQDWCLADAGTFPINDNPIIKATGGTYWVTQISSGNNRVQFKADGRWQPDNADFIAPNTIYEFPNHPGGARIGEVRILAPGESGKPS